MAKVSLEQAVERAVQGIPIGANTKFGKRTFRLRRLDNPNLLKEGETGYFRHVIKGRDNRVFFTIKVKSRNKYRATITRIQYRGVIPGSDTVRFDIDVTGNFKPKADLATIAVAAATELAKKFGPKIAKKLAKKARRKLSGKFEGEAGIVVDAIGQRLAADA